MKKEYCKAYGLRNNDLDSTKNIIEFNRGSELENVPGKVGGAGFGKERMISEVNLDVIAEDNDQTLMLELDSMN